MLSLSVHILDSQVNSFALSMVGRPSSGPPKPGPVVDFPAAERGEPQNTLLEAAQPSEAFFSLPAPPGLALLSLDLSRPADVLMPALIDAFFAQFGTKFPIMRYEAVLGAHLTSTLCACIANCIAAFGIS